MTMNNETGMMSVAPVLEKEPVIEEQTQDHHGYKLLVWNDDVHTFDYVIYVFMKHFGLSEDMATRKTLEVHYQGKSVLAHGSKIDMEVHALVMDLNYGLTATVEEDL